MITNAQRPPAHLWTKVQDGFATEASDYHHLSAEQKVTPCCLKLISKSMMRAVYQESGEDSELTHHEGRCTCGNRIVIYND